LSGSVRLSLDPASLAGYITRQVNAFFPDGELARASDLLDLFPTVIERLDHCFSHVGNRYFFDGETPVFSHLHADQYAMLLYLASFAVGRTPGGRALATKLFLLNKVLHGIDAYFEVELPAVFLFVHPLASVLGRGTYGEFLLVYQRCGVGSNHGIYPTLGEYCTLRPGAAVLGNSRLGRNCTVATESLVLDRDIPSNSTYIGNPRDFVIRPSADLAAIWRHNPKMEIE
jgi:serine O-acetyltransferase